MIQSRLNFSRFKVKKLFFFDIGEETPSNIVHTQTTTHQYQLYRAALINIYCILHIDTERAGGDQSKAKETIPLSCVL